MKRLGLMLAGLLAGIVLALSIPSGAQTEPDNGNERTVTASGTATIEAAPDEAVVSLGVQTRAATAEAAMRENAQRMADVLRALVDLGIRDGDVATTGVSLWPTYNMNGTDIVGYEASNQVDVTVRDMSNVGKAIDAAVGAGANITNGISFRLSDESAGVTDALQAAVADARAKAVALAGAADAQLGRVVEIVEGNAPSVVPPILYDRAVAGAEAASTPIEPPTLETQVSVTVVWELA
jgi:uncharacterized protein